MKYWLASIVVVLLTVQSTHCQEPKRMMRSFSSDDAVILREVGAVVVAKENGLAVDLILGNHEKESDEIQKDDAVLMVNGKKVTTVKGLRKLYEDAPVGSKFKIGLKRGENVQIATFVRKSDEEMNKSGGHGGMVMRMEKKEGEVVLPALGVILATKKNTVVVIGTLPTISKNFKTEIPQEGDLFQSINGTSVTTAEEFDEAYSELSEGDNVTILFSRDGKEMKESFNKPKPIGRVMMRNK